MTKVPALGQGKHCLEIKYLYRFPVAPHQRLAHNAAMPGVPSVSPCPYPLAVIMERERLANRWATEQWEAKGIVRDVDPPGSGERVIVTGERVTQILFPGMPLRLERAEAEGYYLNLTSPQPKIFVLWRMSDDIARPALLTVSYNEGTRWADSGENVDGVALPAELVPWIAEFAAEHYKPEPRKKPRYASSKDKGVASRR
jgi:hypothetical protein